MLYLCRLAVEEATALRGEVESGKQERAGLVQQMRVVEAEVASQKQAAERAVQEVQKLAASHQVGKDWILDLLFLSVSPCCPSPVSCNKRFWTRSDKTEG